MPLKKINIKKPKLKTVISSFFNKFIKKYLSILPISILVSILNTNIINIVIINGKTYYLTCKLKNAKVFAIFIKNLVKKEVKLGINPKKNYIRNILWFFKYFFKEKLRYAFFYQKYNHKITVKKKKKYDHIFLY